MQFFAVVAFCAVGAIAAPNSYGSYEAPIVKMPTYAAPLEVKSAYVHTPSYAEVKSYAPVELKKAIIPIVRYNLNDDNYGTFSFDHVSGDGTTVSQSATSKNLGDIEGPVSVMRGSYSFVSDDGKTYTVNYVADENGFRATGDHLPTPPPVPEEIAQSIALAARTPSYSSYEAPAVVRSSYEAPMIRSRYEAPVVVRSGY